MRQMNATGLPVIAIDLDAPDVPESVRDFHPILFKDGNEFRCILGPDAETGVLGRGQTAAEAMADFDQKVLKLKKNPVTGDDVSDFIQHRHI